MKKILLNLFSFLCLHIIQAQIPTSGLTGYWPFDAVNNANDLSGNNNNGTVYGAILTYDRFGNCNQAYKFNGISNHIVVPNSPTVDMNNTDFTVNIWMKTDINNLDGISISKNQYGSVSGYQFFVSPTNPGYCNIPKHNSFYVAAGAGQDACTNTGIDTLWHFFTGVYIHSTNQVYIYVDGVLQSDVGQSAGNISTTTNLVFGSNTLFSNAYKGILDEIRIYKRALTQSEILAIYNEPDSGTGLTPYVKDTALCSSISITLDAGAASSYTWSTGANTQTVTVNNLGTYWVQVQNQAGCKTTDSIHVKLSDISSNVKDTLICSTTSITLNAVTAASYTWSTGVNTQTVTVNNSDTYWVQLQSPAGCGATDSIHVKFSNFPSNVKDTTTCLTASITLDAGTASSYTWSTGVNTQTVTVNNSGTYWVQLQNQAGCRATDSIHVNFSNFPSRVKDTTTCSTTSITLNAGTAVSYTWSTGANTQTVTVNNSGTYWVQLQNQAGCRATDSIYVYFTPPPIINIIKDTTVCNNANYVLNASQANAATYQWSTGASSSSIISAGSGIYWVDMLIGNCYVRDSATVVMQNPPVTNITKDTFLCKEPILITIPDTSLQVTWWNNSHAYQILINTIGTYHVSLYKKGCTTIDTIHVKPVENSDNFLIPNIFTPNNDGKNDVFEFKTGSENVIEFKIYNRWGRAVYSVSNGSVSWDGKQENELVDDGVYFWEGIFNHNCVASQENIRLKGFISILK